MKDERKGTQMSGETDLIKLYSGQILGLASDIPFTDRLKSPDGTCKKRAPLCGSTITVDIKLSDGKITEFGQDVKACALGQAAASVVARNVIGADRTQIETVRDALKAMLKEDGPTPPAPFQDLEVLRPAREYKNRHASILLSLEATLDAIDQAQQSACA